MNTDADSPTFDFDVPRRCEFCGDQFRPALPEDVDCQRCHAMPHHARLLVVNARKQTALLIEIKHELPAILAAALLHKELLMSFYDDGKVSQGTRIDKQQFELWNIEAAKLAAESARQLQAELTVSRNAGGF